MTTKAKSINGGFLVIFEGIDGVGKTTQVNIAKETLDNEGYKVIITRNLGGSPIGEQLREVMLSKTERPPLVNLYISVAIQEALIAEVKLLKKKGYIILLDRGPISLVAYQGYGSGLNKKLCLSHAEQGMVGLKPNLTLLYNAPLDKTLLRVIRKKGAMDYFETKPRQYFKNVLKGYQELSSKYKTINIDASGDIASVSQKTMEVIKDKLFY